MQGLLMLPKDIRVVPVAELPEALRTQVGAAGEGVAIARSNSRVASKIVDEAAWSLLEHFREPKTVVDAVMRYSRAIQAKPSEVFEQAFPLLNSLYANRLLVDADAQDSASVTASYQPGDNVGGYTVVRNVQTLADTELYEARTESGASAALKITRPCAGSHIPACFDREAKVLQLIGGSLRIPELFGAGTYDGRHYVAMEWRDGTDAATAAAPLRSASRKEELRALCQQVLDAYAELHAVGVLHGDVHPRNLIVGRNGDVTIVDFGITVAPGLGRAPRGGIAMFHDPEHAREELNGKPGPPLTPAAEQYSVAALVYSLLCGSMYADFPPGREELLKQIVEAEPVRFVTRGRFGFSAVEDVIRRALDKAPDARWPDLRAFAEAFRAACEKDREDERATAYLAPPAADVFVNRVLDQLREPSQDLKTRGLRAPLASVTYGAAGIACALHSIAAVRDDADLFARADLWSEFAASMTGDPRAFYSQDVMITPQSVGKASPYHTSAGVHAVRALLAHARADRAVLDAYVGQFLAASHDHTAENDLTLGKGSSLIGLSLIGQTAAMREPVLDFGDRLFAAMWSELDVLPAIREAPPSQPVALAHGWAGYLYASLRWIRERGRALDNRPHAASLPHGQLTERLEQLRSTKSNIQGWCNGNAGFLFLWTLAYDVLREPEFLTLAEHTAAEVAAGRPEIQTLCCGAAGSAYSLLSLYRLTQDTRWLRGAQKLAEAGIEVSARSTARGENALPLSLYKGDTGLAVLLEQLRSPETAAMPFFEGPTW